MILPPAPMMVLWILAGILMWTPPQSSMIDWMILPPAPMMVLWILAGILTSMLTTLAFSAWIFWISSLAFSTSAFLPVMVIMSESEPLSGRSILVFVSCLIWLMVAPDFPMINLWNCLKM